MYAEVLKELAHDGTELFGLAHDPDGPRDLAIVYVHGLGSTGRSHLADGLARRLPPRGVGVIRGDLRECDLLRIDELPTEGRVRKGGGAYHPFQAGVADAKLWIDVALRRGYQSVVVFGHSLGSLRATHLIAEELLPQVVGLVLASTADLIAMHASRYDEETLQEYLTLARHYLEQGQGDEIMPPECSVGLMRQPISARSYVDRFGNGAWDVMDLFDRGSPTAFAALRRIAIPILATFGTRNETVPSERLDHAFDRLRQEAVLAPSFETHVFEGADHFYLGFADQVADRVAKWMDTALSSSRPIEGE
jgi:pimeloyl-ACP methyl ester carboxylesterase